MKILMVCLGNICRSPLAEGILKHKAAKQGLKIIIDSAGTSNYHIDDMPDKRSIAIAEKYGIDISSQLGRQFSRKDFDEFDFIYAMDKNNLKDILNLARNKTDKQKVDLILNCSKPGEDLSVPDPYYGGEKDFENIYTMLDEACDAILNQIK
jgi:protein-tyrosine phosphatase